MMHYLQRYYVVTLEKIFSTMSDAEDTTRRVLFDSWNGAVSSEYAWRKSIIPFCFIFYAYFILYPDTNESPNKTSVINQRMSSYAYEQKSVGVFIIF